jgi:hypothetical protein
MLKHMFLGLGAASLLVVVTAMPVQAAHIVPLEFLGHEPAPSFIVTRGAWEWVWVSPCAEGQQSCSFIKEGEDYGFLPPEIIIDDSNPTNNSNPWTESFPEGYLQLANAFIPPDNPAGNCAYKFFSEDYSDAECGTGDLLAGAVWDSPYILAINERLRFSGEVVWVRPSGAISEPPPSSPLPEPSSLLLLGAGLLGLAAWRWKHAA